jgi:hypothetical protein
VGVYFHGCLVSSTVETKLGNFLGLFPKL